MNRPKVVLVVDDEPAMTRVLAAVLEDAGYRAQIAGSGVEAIHRLADDELPDIVLLDFLMPGKDGCETLREMRANARLAALPVVIMSGLVESMLRQRCGQSHYHGYVRKPFELDTLLGIVAAALNRRPRPRR